MAGGGGNRPEASRGVASEPSPDLLAPGRFIHGALRASPCCCCLISPWYLFLAMSYMNHIFTLTCALVAFWGIMQARATGLAWWTFAAGLAIGIASTIRPPDGAIMALLGEAWVLARRDRSRQISQVPSNARGRAGSCRPAPIRAKSGSGARRPFSGLCFGRHLQSARPSGRCARLCVGPKRRGAGQDHEPVSRPSGLGAGGS